MWVPGGEQVGVGPWGGEQVGVGPWGGAGWCGSLWGAGWRGFLVGGSRVAWISARGEQVDMGVQGLTGIFTVYLLPSCPPLIRLHSSLVTVCELPSFCAKFS